MRVVIINRSDMAGGAAVASHRLLHGLRHAGVDAMMLVVDRQDIDVYAQPIGGAIKNKWNFLAERLGIFMRNGFSRDTLFKIDTATHGLNVNKNEFVDFADVIVLNWINQGTMSLKSIKKLASMGKPIVWTMHDMWNCTGVCHHAYECEAYKDVCRDCPLLKSKGDDLSTRTQRAKKELYDKVPIHFVAVSNWLADRCRQSSLMRNRNVSVIANSFPTDEFEYERRSEGSLNIDPSKKVVVMGAARLDDTVKGFDQLIATTKVIAEKMPELASQIHLVLYGDIKDASLLDQIAIPYSFIGRAYDVNAIFTQADVVLSTSLYESLPTTLIEGMASGCVPVTYGEGGQPDIVDHKVTGYIAEYKNPEDMARGIEWAINAGISRQTLHETVESRFDSQVIAQKYIELFNKLINKR
jgi:glycosyltransferase involved in cell wall biosynthesis